MMAARKSLRDLDNDALAHTAPEPAPAPVSAAKSSPAPAKKPAAPRKGAKKPATASTSTIGVYLQRPTFDAARGAYMADLDTLPDGPDTFARWIDAALAEYAALDVAARQSIAEQLPEEERSEARGINRTFHIGQDTIEAANAALVEDRQAGRWRSRSELAVEAIQWATQAAKERNGGVLPQAPPRLPNGGGR